MEFFICERTKVLSTIKKHNITDIVSLVDSPSCLPYLTDDIKKNSSRLIQYFEDIDVEKYPTSPTKEHVKTILDWAANCMSGDRLLVHCEAGISRSTAACLAIMVQHYGTDRIDECVARLLEIRPIALPNILICHYADELLGTGNKLETIAKNIINSKLIEWRNR